MKGPLLAALWLLLASPAAFAQILIDGGSAGQVSLRRPTAAADDRPQLRLVRDARLVWQARSRDFDLLDPPLRPAPGGPALTGITGWSGGAYCCWTLHVFARTGRGLVHAGDIPLGKRSPEGLQLQAAEDTTIRIADPAHDFWDYIGSLGADIGPLLPFAWNGQRLAVDTAALRRGTATGCALPAPASPEAWSAFHPGQPHPATEIARAALCLIYTGRASAVGPLLAGFPPAEAGLRAATEAQLRARLACSAHAAMLRRINARTSLIPDRCSRDSPDHTAVARALEERPRPR